MFRERIFNRRIIRFHKVVLDILHRKRGLAYPREVNLSSAEIGTAGKWRAGEDTPTLRDPITAILRDLIFVIVDSTSGPPG